MRKLLLALSISAFIVGCNNSEISLVKNGVMSDYKSLTVGEAFGNWQICDKSQSKWDLITTSNGIKAVQYECNVKNVEEINNTLKAEAKQKNDESIKSENELIANIEQKIQSNTSEHLNEFYQEQLENTKSRLQNLLAANNQDYPAFDMSKIVYTFQWTVNKDDAFELSYGDVEYFWQNKSHNEKLAVHNILDMVYQNTNPFDINSEYSYMIAPIIQRFYYSAK